MFSVDIKVFLCAPGDLVNLENSMGSRNKSCKNWIPAKFNKSDPELLQYL